eukprot:CAMPEP_0183720354 /NCGR_PEP_ID=MMETSP0737-20130205/12991_1 /TAXON_ID=385413 /ORGANISM="Thalassiosira miniscula, Strain CCMP1093" /LENGTH=561 /DNA_ID=CAMNT_0025950201 /DNA_START=75 /DNA_END=1757 /DNA_ORIENTATION=+
MATPKNHNSRRSARPITCVLIATLYESSHSIAPPRAHGNAIRFPLSSTTLISARPRPSSSNWEDDTKSSRNNAEITDYRPPWRDHDSAGNNGNVSKDAFQHKSKRPPGMPAGAGGEHQPQMQDNQFRHPFQMSSTDDFKRPHGMPTGMDQQQTPPRMNGFKSPFQTSTMDDFKRSSDVASGVEATQQPIYSKPSRSDTPPWQNQVGQDSFDATQPQKIIYDATIIDDQDINSEQGNSHPNAEDTTPLPPPVTPEQHTLEQWDKKLEVAQSTSKRTLLHSIQWPLDKDPPGVSTDFPMVMTRVMVTTLATLSTRYLHLINGCSPVLASSAFTLLVSTCFDRRLGQAALCGTFAGMSGGHLTPNLSMTVLLGALTSTCYELLIHVNNLCLGIGGRLGATAFLATSIMAKYQGVSILGRRMRRGLWKSGAGPSNILVTMVLYHIIGSVATIFLRESSDDSAAADPVRASSVVGLVGSLYLNDPMSVLALYGGSFVGMSLPSRLMYGNTPGRSKAFLTHTALALFGSFAVAGAIAGIIHAVTIHHGYWNGGWGGKAGLCAFAGFW